MVQIGMSDIKGKAVRETATERGREGVSILKDEMTAKRALTRSGPLTRPLGLPVYVAASQLAPFGGQPVHETLRSRSACSRLALSRP